ncbi:MAG: OmpA family protein [Myxococcota bacterium]
MRRLREAFGTLFVITLVACGPTYPNCDEDDDCRDGEYCVDNQCQQCRTDSHCPAGQQCVGGRCEDIDGYCSSNADCPDGQECRGNRCVAEASTNVSEPITDTGPTQCELRTVYFSFDSEELDSSARDAISANARCVRDRSIARVHLTGFTDPRGTEEYNLALGDRRARAVLQYMSSLGVERGNLSASSMGEEMSRGQDEAGFRNDRKVTFTEQ